MQEVSKKLSRTQNATEITSDRYKLPLNISQKKHGSNSRHRVNQLKAVEQNSSSDNEVIGLMVCHVLAAGNVHLDTESDRSS